MVSSQKHPTDRPLAVHKVSWQGKSCPEVGQASGPRESPGLVAFLPYGERASRQQSGQKQRHRGTGGDVQVRAESRLLFGRGRSRDNRIRKRNKQNFKSSKSH